MPFTPKAGQLPAPKSPMQEAANPTTTTGLQLTLLSCTIRTGTAITRNYPGALLKTVTATDEKIGMKSLPLLNLMVGAGVAGGELSRTTRIWKKRLAFLFLHYLPSTPLSSLFPEPNT